MYEIGRVYVWQNRTGDAARLNGQETIVIDRARITKDRITGRIALTQMTDTPSVTNLGGYVSAEHGELRPKNPPPGEQKIRSMFEPKPVMEVA